VRKISVRTVLKNQKRHVAWDPGEQLDELEENSKIQQPACLCLKTPVDGNTKMYMYII